MHSHLYRSIIPKPTFQMSAHQPNLGTDGRDASTSNSHLGHGSKHAVDGQVRIYLLFVFFHSLL